MNKIRKILVILLLILIYSCLVDDLVSPASAVETNERMVVRVGAYENEPKIFTDANGRVVGIFPDILERIATLEGWDIQYVHGTWEECLDRLEKGNMDLMVDVAYSEERAKKFNFCKETVFVNWGVVYVPEGSHIESYKDLQGKTVAMMKRSIHTVGKIGGIKSILKESRISCDFVETGDYKGVFELITSGKADAGVVNRLFGEMNAQQYRVKDTSMIFDPSQLRFAYPMGSEKAQIIAERVDHYLRLYKSLPESVYYQTLEQYLYGAVKGAPVSEMVPGSTARFSLSQQDKAWLKQHPVIRVVLNPEWAPIEFVDGGEPYGITIDYLRKFEKKLGVQFEFAKEPGRRQAIDRLKSGELDMSGAICETSDRKNFLTFTSPYLSVPIVMFSRDDITYIGNMDQLNDKKVAILDGYATQKLLPKDYPNIQWVAFESIEEALRGLNQGEVEAFINNIITTSYYIGKTGLSHIKVVGETPYRYNVSMAARVDTPLASILDKTLASVPQSERETMYQKWFTVKYEHGFNYTLLWKILAGVFLVILAIVYWNRRLSHEVAQRTEELAATSQRLSDIIEFLPDATFVIDQDKKVIAWNRAAELMTGTNKESIIGTNGYGKAFFGADRPILIDLLDIPSEEWEKTYKYVKRIGDSIYAESFIPTLYNGKGAHLWGVASPLFDENGNRTGSIETIRDVSDRAQAEMGLKESMRRFKELARLLPALVYEIDLQGKFLFFSDAAFPMFGYSSRDTTLKLDVFMLVTPESRKLIEKNMKDLLAGVNLGPVTYYGVRKDGTVFPMEVYGSLIMKEGKPVGVRGIAIDVTERAKMEETLRQTAEERRELEFIVNKSTAVAFLWKAAENWPVEYVSESIRQFGYTPEDFYSGRVPFASIIHADDLQRVAAEVTAYSREPGRDNFAQEYRIISSSGKVYWLDDQTWIRRNDAGEITHYQGIVIDITVRKLAEAQLMATLGEKEVLLREVHHRVKNNLQVINSLISLQQEHITDKKAAASFADIHNRVMSMAMVHENLYASGTYTEIRLSDYVKTMALNLFKTYNISPEDIMLKTAIDDIPLDVDMAIPCSIIINELVSNSLKHAFPDKRKGETMIEFHKSTENVVQLIVRDNGVGIPENIDLESSKNFGLWLVKILADQLGGTVVIEQEKGTKVTVEFPVKFRIPKDSQI